MVWAAYMASRKPLSKNDATSEELDGSSMRSLIEAHSRPYTEDNILVRSPPP